MDSSKLSIKLFVEGTPELDQFVPVFHAWIQNHALADHLLVDVADYAHVHNGPGIVLVSHEANISLDTRGGRAGLTYQRKQPVAGAFSDRLATVWRHTLQAASLLKERAKFRTDEIEFRICDRLAAPNNAATFEAVKADLLSLFAHAKLEHRASPQELFSVIVKPARVESLDALVKHSAT